MGLKGNNRLQLRLEHNGETLYEVLASEVAQEITIGRSAESTWVIPATDRSASNHHAVIRRKRGSLFVVDAKSRNGIYFKGAKVPEHKLAAGDQIGIGDCRLYVEKLEKQSGGPLREFNRLEQLNGEKKGSLYDLDKPMMRLGSASDCEIVLNDSVISHFHASIEQRSDGSSWIRDLGSRNGTQVNGVPLTGGANDSGRLLKDGDIITISFVELKFWDKFAEHVRSFWLLKTLTCVLTFAILCGGYYMWQSAMPSAKKYIDSARECARAKDFAGARAQLEAAATARRAERHKLERQELLQQVNQWEETIKNWAEVKELLANSKWVSANKILSPMLSQNMELWRWNDTDATVAKNEAIATKKVIDAYLQGRAILEDSESSMELQEKSALQLRQELSALGGNPPEFCGPLVSYTQDTLDELDFTVREQRRITGELEALSTLEKLDSVIANIQSYKEQVAAHNQERQSAKKRFSPNVVRLAGEVLEPLLKLQQAKNVLDANYAAAAALEFDRQEWTLPLPSVEECAVYPVMADNRMQLDRLNKQLENDSIQLGRIWKFFQAQGLATGQTPECLAHLGDAKVLAAVLACDCLQKPLPKWGRTEPASQYDRILGVEVFYDFLMQLPSPFDSGLLEDRPFQPEIYQARTLYSYLEMLIKFMAQDTLAMVKAQKTNNRIVALSLKADDLLMQRDALVEELVADAESLEGRQAIIAGGMAVLLAKEGRLDEAFREGVVARLRKLRQQTSRLQSGEMTPEQAIAIRKKVLEIGFPGDSFVKQSWSMEVSE
ncbi:MAG: FHA domain-containing protein [Victivallales bacterium]|nr:FHA domain-containing protein [Victivallales bacterium]